MPGNGLEKKFSLGEWHLDLEPFAPLWMGCRQIKTVHMTPCWTEGASQTGSLARSLRSLTFLETSSQCHSHQRVRRERSHLAVVSVGYGVLGGS